jgi:hypothetical protein
MSARQPILVQAAHEHGPSGFRVLGTVRRRAGRLAHRGQPFLAAEDTEKAGESAPRVVATTNLRGSFFFPADPAQKHTKFHPPPPETVRNVYYLFSSVINL